MAWDVTVQSVGAPSRLFNHTYSAPGTYVVSISGSFAGDPGDGLDFATSNIAFLNCGVVTGLSGIRSMATS